MQTGVVQAMEGTPEVGCIQRICEVARYPNKTQHIFFDGSFVTSTRFLDTLNEENREVAFQAALDLA